MCFAKSFSALASPLKAVSCLGRTTQISLLLIKNAKVMYCRKKKYHRCFTYLMSSMVRRAELQTMSRTTELLFVCCFWILDHFGQTKHNRKKKRKVKLVCPEVNSQYKIYKLDLEHYSLCFRYEEKLCVRSLLDRKQESGRCERADSDRDENNRSANIDWMLKWTRPDSPCNLSSSCSITERLSEKYCATRFCRSAGQPGFDSEEAKTSVIVFFFFCKTKLIFISVTVYATITVYNSRCRHRVHTLTFLFLLGFSDFSSSVSVFWGVTTSFCNNNTCRKHKSLKNTLGYDILYDSVYYILLT